jgi:hypothetical protein
MCRALVCIVIRVDLLRGVLTCCRDPNDICHNAD